MKIFIVDTKTQIRDRIYDLTPWLEHMARPGMASDHRFEFELEPGDIIDGNVCQSDETQSQKSYNKPSIIQSVMLKFQNDMKMTIQVGMRVTLTGQLNRSDKCTTITGSITHIHPDWINSNLSDVNIFVRDCMTGFIRIFPSRLITEFIIHPLTD